MAKVSFVAVFIACVLCMTGTSYAVSIGLPYDTDRDTKHFFLALEDSYIINKDFDSSDNALGGGAIDSSNATYAKVGYAFNDYIGVYTKLGMQSLEVDMDIKSGANTAAYDIEYDSGFMWTIGACGGYEFENTGVRLGYDIQYGQTTFDFGTLTVNGTRPGTFSGSSPGLSEFSLAVLVSKKFDLGNEEVRSATPYGGIRYSNTNVDFGTVTNTSVTVNGIPYTGFSGSVDSKNVIGLFLGCSVDVYDSFMLGLEGRFVDEEAFTVNGTYKF